MKCALASLALVASLASSVLAKDHANLRRQHRVVARTYGSSSEYGSSDSSYGNSGYGGAEVSNYGGVSAAAAVNDASAAMAHKASTSAMVHGTTAKAAALETSTVAHVASSTASANEVKPTQYGSGYVAPSYDSCVQTCQATYGQSIMGAPKEVKGAEAAPPAANDTVLVAGPGQVVVAPIKGDLRFVPFAIEGKSVEYVWGAGPHTVTQSSTLALCNATLEEGAFKSGQQNATFKFNVEVKDTTKPTWVFCGVATHCIKGMFSVINPAKTTTASASFGAYMDTLASTDPAFASKMNETKTYCAANSAAWRWGSLYDIAQVPEESRSYAMYNTLATRVYFTDNPQLLSVSTPTNASSTGTTSATFASGTADAQAQAALSGASEVKLSVLAALFAGVMTLVLV